MFQVNLGVVYSAIHTIHPSTGHLTILFLFCIHSSCLSLKPKYIHLAPTSYGGQREQIWPLLSRRAALQGEVGNAGEVTGVHAELHRAE